jgi:glutathione S-transferase
MYGLSHAMLSEGGLGWSVRLLLTHAGLITEGREGWPAPVAAYLAPKYGYAPERVPGARVRAIRVLNLLARTLADSEAAGHLYMLGPTLTALDVYAATMLGVIAPLPHEMCPMPDVLRHAIATLDPDVRAAVPASLLRHRDLMYARHLRLPVRL